MNCVIPGPNLKILGKAIHAFSKLGEDIYLEATEDELSLRTVNARTTVFAVIKFLPPFFTHYKINEVDTEQMSNNQKGVSCKMPMKALSSVFKSPNQMEKQVEICKIVMDNSPKKIMFNFRYKHDVCKTQSVWISDSNESLEIAVFNNDTVANKISASSLLYTQALFNFQITDSDISVEATPQKIIFRNYVEDVAKINHVRSQLSLSPSEFSLYKINKKTTVSFCLRPLRAAIHFAETFNLGLTLTFEQSGKPVQIMISNNITFEANFVLATMSTDSQTQSTVITETIPSKQTEKKTVEEVNKTPIPIANNKTNLHISNNWNSDFNTDDINSEPIVIPDVPESVESPRSKKMKFLFNRCLEPTYNGAALLTDEEIYAENSDPECEALLL